VNPADMTLMFCSLKIHDKSEAISEVVIIGQAFPLSRQLDAK
jgi:hypothetical protein